MQSTTQFNMELNMAVPPPPLDPSTLIAPQTQNDPMVFSTEESAPQILSIDDLLNENDVILKKETDDRTILEEFVNPTLDQIKPMLLEWARAGFPALYAVRHVNILPPSLCSDGKFRSLLPYYEYIMEKPMTDTLVSLQSKTKGMVFTFSHNGSTTISLMVSKD